MRENERAAQNHFRLAEDGIPGASLLEHVTNEVLLPVVSRQDRDLVGGVALTCRLRL